MAWPRQKMLRVWTSKVEAEEWKILQLKEEVPAGELFHKLLLTYLEKMAGYDGKKYGPILEAVRGF